MPKYYLHPKQFETVITKFACALNIEFQTQTVDIWFSQNNTTLEVRYGQKS
jgi:hypothetical protein